MSRRITVVGGGWAGCAAALTLAEAGCRVTLLEAAPQLGGRARAIRLAGQALDNGQHILLGAYTQTLALLRRVHAGPESGYLLRLPLELASPPDFVLRCPDLPAPLHLLAGVLGARGLGWRDKLATLAAARRLMGHAPLPASVGAALAGQPATAWKYLWEPLCLAALNTPPGQACATSFRAVLQGAFAGRREHSDLLLPRHDLGALFPEPAAARLRALGGEVVLGRRVRNLSLERDRVVLDGDSACDGVVLAVAPWHAAALLQPLPALAAGLAAYPTEAIATAYLRYPASVHLPKPMLGLAGGPGQYAFDRGASHGQHGLIAVVASAANGLAASPREAWLARIADQAEALLGARPVWARGVLEKRATWACVPGLERPPIATPHPRLVLAGDYTAGPYPATLESACCSGVQSAHTLLRHLP